MDILQRWMNFPLSSETEILLSFALLHTHGIHFYYLVSWLIVC
jgi:hypothetical protein